jgi:hypothetical protein
MYPQKKYIYSGGELEACIHDQGGRLLDSKTVMARYGYKSRASFWQFVASRGVPRVVLNARKIMFDPQALAAWEARRSVGRHQRTA